MLRFSGLLFLVVTSAWLLVFLGHSLLSAPLLLVLFVASFEIIVSLLAELRRVLA
jgi:hypothetical protein